MMTACSKDDVYPIRFAQQYYTIKDLVTTSIFYVDGGGVYEVEIGNPSVIERARIDVEYKMLVVTPKATGESTITIKDTKTESTVILNITVTDFYLGFKVNEINGENNNPYISRDCEIRYIRTPGNTKKLRIVAYDNLSNKEEVIADGFFDMIKGDKEFILEMSLHNGEKEGLESFSYFVKGNDAISYMFSHCFEFGWEESHESRSLPVQRVNMDLTEINNDCLISTVFVQ